MFGYVKPFSPLLRVKDDEFYKAVYCGLCGCTAKCNGCSSTLTLSYDIAFFSLVRLALAGEKITLLKKRCLVHPMKKRTVLAPSDELEFCSGVGVLLSYYKIIDNINDEKGKKRIAAILMKPFFSSARRRVIKNGGAEADEVISRGLSELRALEKEKCKSVDTVSDLFGKMLASLASLGLEGKNKIIAENAGAAVGKWIYVIDAVDDVEKDAEDPAYNPVLALYDGVIPDKKQTEDILLALSVTKERLSAALDLIDYREESVTADAKTPEAYFSDELRAVIENIVHIGMPRVEQKIIDSKKA